ncbi:hypothetical protein [Parasphingorhabdus sp.]|jgi:hypothetical protein|uniref:hypothetical protein n=1 Tax=Parasphingorhabdus sp. TaxID=2709688 RepID=UPI003D2AB8DA
MSDDNNNDAQRSQVPTHVNLNPSTALDLSGLSDAERSQMLIDYKKGMLDLGLKAQELHVDVKALEVTLGTLTDTTRTVSQDGNSVTVSHTQTTSVGRTEIIMGNTESAKVGKLTKSQTGEKDWTPIYIIAGIIALVLIASAFAS